MNDAELTTIVMTCGGPYTKGNLTASFIPTNDLVVRWTRSSNEFGKEYMNLRFPESFKLAPVGVIRDITKKVIQQVCYSSDYEISEETMEWLSSLRELMDGGVA